MSTASTPAPIVRRMVGQVALVTGAARGIGRAIAVRFAEEGAKVAVLDLNEDGITQTCAAVREAGGEAFPYIASVTDRPGISAVIDDLIAKTGRLDILVNNAAVGKPVPFLDLTDEDWNRIHEVNLTGYFIPAQEAARRMVKQGSGRIVNVASLAAHTANYAQAAYASAKGGVVALTQNMAFELAPLGVMVNAVSPGPIDTDLAKMMLTDAERDKRNQRVPQGRFGRPEEVAAAVAFLASSDASYINSTTLIIDGGLLIGGVR